MISPVAPAGTGLRTPSPAVARGPGGGLRFPFTLACARMMTGDRFRRPVVRRMRRSSRRDGDPVFVGRFSRDGRRASVEFAENPPRISPLTDTVAAGRDIPDIRSASPAEVILGSHQKRRRGEPPFISPPVGIGPHPSGGGGHPPRLPGGSEGCFSGPPPSGRQRNAGHAFTARSLP